jgi:hypothetical protein
MCNWRVAVDQCTGCPACASFELRDSHPKVVVKSDALAALRIYPRTDQKVSPTPMCNGVPAHVSRSVKAAHQERWVESCPVNAAGFAELDPFGDKPVHLAAQSSLVECRVGSATKL